MYTGFRLPDDGTSSKETERRLNRIREGAYKTVSQQPSPVTRPR